MKFDAQKLLKTVRSAAGTACEEAQGVVRDGGKILSQTQQLARLKMEAAGLKSDRRERFEALGRLAYVIHRAEEPSQDILDQYNAVCQELDHIDAALERVEEEINRAKGQASCPACGRSCPADFRFCPNCGAPLPSREPAAPGQPDTQIEGQTAPAAEGTAPAQPDARPGEDAPCPEEAPSPASQTVLASDWLHAPGPENQP